MVHLWTLCQKAETFLVMWTVGVKVSAPYLRIGKRSEEAMRSHRKGGRPFPGGESLFTATKAACALANLLTKCGVVESEGVNKLPSHLTSFLGLKIDPSKWIGGWEIGAMSLLVRQWMSSVLGIEKLTPSRAPLALSQA